MYEFDFFNGTHFITFNLIAYNKNNNTVTIAITEQSKIIQDTFTLLKDNSGNLYFEYGLYCNKIYLKDFTYRKLKEKQTCK